jgi:hypothetical protein
MHLLRSVIVTTFIYYTEALDVRYSNSSAGRESPYIGSCSKLAYKGRAPVQ